jgi:hypothetical protein
MKARFGHFTPVRESAEQLRADTARLLHRVTTGRSPLVGAKLGVSKARIQNQIAGDCANPLELLYRWIDCLEADGVERTALDEIARDFADRRGFDLAPRLRVASRPLVIPATAAAAREIGEALAAALDRCMSHESKLREVRQAIEALHALRGSLEKEQHQAGVVSA